MARFSVDTHLFRELGELLVGRDSTALIELIKNSYDADATEVIVHGENLDDQQRGRIVILDNGTGMTRDRFVSGFLRVASRLKDQGTRRSTVFRAPLHWCQRDRSAGSPQTGASAQGLQCSPRRTRP